MKEELISFEVAKLAHEKGFNHVKANCFGDNMAYQLPEGNLIYSHNGSTVSGYILAPTQALLQKWLREVHSIDIYCEPHSDKGDLQWVGMLRRIDHTVNNVFLPLLSKISIQETYELALENALEKALKLIK